MKDLEATLRASERYSLRKPPWQRFAVYGAQEFVAKSYRPRDGSRYIEISRKGKGLEYIVEKDAVTGGKEAEFNSREVLHTLPAVFFVSSIEQLFKMFFPES